MKPYWIIKYAFLAILAILALSTVVMLLWNWLAPSLFNRPQISLWQALGLLALARILFGNFGQGRWGGGRMARKQEWRRKFEEKWKTMSPEEQARFKATMKNRCSNWGWMARESTADAEKA